MDDKLLLAVMQKNARIKMRDLAAVLDESKEDVINRVTELEKEKVIAGYHTIINWDKSNTDIVTAMIEIKASPEREYGYDRIASRIYKFEEVESVYLISGEFDLAVMIEGKSMREVANFVSSKLSPLESVLSTSTNFILKKYKEHGLTLTDESPEDERMLITP